MMDFTFGIDRAGQFDIEGGYGDIVALATENKKLIIFTSRAIFEFCAIGARTDYTLKRIECDYLNVLENSVRDIGDRIIFVSDRKIYYYKSGKVYLEQSFLGDNDCIITNAPALDGKIYYLPISYKGEEFLFRYDLDNKKYNFITAISNDLFDGEYPVYKNISMYKIDKVDVQKTPVYTAKSVLDKTTKKVMVKIIAYVVGSATLTLNGNSGSCKIQLKDGLNEKKIRLSSISFLCI